MVKLNKKLIKEYMNNTSSNATDETYSCDYINNCNTYSTSETLTGGYWIDGKPIYRKVITNTYSETSSDFTLLNGVSELIFGTGYVQGSGGTKIQVPGMKSSMRVNTSNQLILEANQLVTVKYCVAVEYTKTTD